MSMVVPSPFPYRRILAGLLVLALLLISWPVPAQAVPVTLRNGGFEDPYVKKNDTTYLADGWSPYYGKDGSAKVNYFREDKQVHSGKTSQKIEVIVPGGMHFYHKVNLTKGKKYEAFIYLRADTPMKVTFSIRQAADPQETYAAKTFTVDSVWRAYSVKGVLPADVTAQLQIQALEKGVLYADSARLEDITPTGAIVPANASTPVPASHFGLHLNKLGDYKTWPQVKPGLIRLWDTATNWYDVEPENDKWNWDTLNFYVDFIKSSDASAEIVYTLGQTPYWVSENPNDTSCKYAHREAGSCHPPKNMDEWAEYVAEVARMYKGKIQYYELWNEPNLNEFFKGDTNKLLKMAEAADKALQSVDPNLKLIAPGFTQFGYNWLNDFLAGGGDKWVDMYSFHYYFSDYNPDKAAALASNIRDLLDSYQVNKPLYLTEGSAWRSAGFSNDKAMGAVAKLYLQTWVNQVSSVGWYMWDEDYVHDAGRVMLSNPGYKEPTPAGMAYAQILKWMKGSKVTSYNMNHDGGGTALFRMTRQDGRQAAIVWNDKTAPPAYKIPADWGAVTVYELNGLASPASGGQSISVGTAPKMILRNP